jgi:hypothetical protein
LLELESTLFTGTEQIRLSDYQEDLGATAERMYQGLDQALDSWVAGNPEPRKFGFG